MTFEQWLISIGKSPKSSKNYSQAVFGSINKWAQEATLLNEDIASIQSVSEISSLFEKLKNLEEFVKFNSQGKGMYSAALKQYINYMDDISGHSINEDISTIVSEETLKETEKVLLISARIGQGQFRKDLISYWQGCTLTGFANTRFLVASHIKPWRNSSNKERLDLNNGLLLLPNYDKAFDLGYISFDNDGKILISNQLDNYVNLGISANQSFEIKEGNRPYLRFHRENIFNTN
jgi:hypothetical protein